MLEDKIDSAAVHREAKDIIKDQPVASDAAFHYHQVARLHEYVRNKIEYNDRSHQIAKPPDVTLQTRSGGRDSHATLMTSLLESIGATVRLAECKSTDGEWHIVPEVYLADTANGETSDICDSLIRYYDSSGQNYSEFYYDYADDRVWYPVDSIMGRYVGDIQLLSEKGYVRGPRQDYSWSWNHVNYVYSSKRTIENIDLDEIIEKSSGRGDLEKRLEQVGNQGYEMKTHCPQCDKELTEDITRSVASSLASSLVLETICPGCGTFEIVINDWSLFNPF